MTRVIGALVGGALMGGAWAVIAPVTIALAGEPAASPAVGGDPRSPGQGPGLVGDPLFAIGAVLVVALLSVVLTLAYVRLTADRAGSTRGRDDSAHT